MASVSNNNFKVTYPRYLRSLKAKEVASRTATVLATAGIGAGVGAGIGIGGGPGVLATVPACAGLGAGVGAVVGIAIASAYDASEYRKFKKSLTTEAKLKLEEFIKDRGDYTTDDICGIGSEIPCDPVVIEGEPQVYERKEIVKYIRSKGESPMTRKKITESNLEQAYEHMARTGNLCARILNNPLERETLDTTILKGLVLLQKDNDKRTRRFIERKYQKNRRLVSKGKLNFDQNIAEAINLKKIFDEAFGDVALRNRHKININKLVIDQLDLKKNQKKSKAESVEEKAPAA